MVASGIESLPAWPQAVALVAAAAMGITTYLLSGRKNVDGRRPEGDDIVAALIRQNERLQTNVDIQRVKEDFGQVIQAVRESLFVEIKKIENEINGRLLTIELSNVRIEQMLRDNYPDIHKK